jgi:hypothetical protein
MKENVAHYVTKPISHNPWIALWVVVCVAVLLYLHGCESTVKVDGEKVTRSEYKVIVLEEEKDYLTARSGLLAQVETLDAQRSKEVEITEENIEELNRQDEKKAQLLEGFVSLAVQFLPAAQANTLSTVVGTLFPLGIGAFYLNGRRKDKVIAEKSSK